MQSLMPPIESSDSLFHDGNPLTGERGTIVTAKFLNDVQSATRDLQSELISVLASAGLLPDPDQAGQLLSSLKKILLQRTNPFADIAADGAAAVAAALSNLGLASGTPPIGIPFFWPSAALPNTVMTEWANMVFLKFNGATFSAATYPKLALVIPSLTLVEARGEFPRIWDDGRGVDSGRALLSAQNYAIQNIIASFTTRPGVASGSTNAASTVVQSSGAMSIRPLSSSTAFVPVSTTGSTGYGGDVVSFDASNVVNTASETRGRNIAFNFLVRAK